MPPLLCVEKARLDLGFSYVWGKTEQVAGTLPPFSSAWSRAVRVTTSATLRVCMGLKRPLPVPFISPAELLGWNRSQNHLTALPSRRP